MIIQLEISSQAFKYDFTQIDCFDLTIGNMLSFYDPELFDLYCAYCSIYCNHSKAKDYNRIISFNFGYNMDIKCSPITDEINYIHDNLAVKSPLIFSIPCFCWYTSSGYKLDYGKKLNYNVIISGIDTERELIYYHDSSMINNDLLHNLTESNIFIKNSMTFDMFRNMINLSKINKLEYLFIKLSKYKDVSFSSLLEKLIPIYRKLLINDNLIQYHNDGKYNNEYIIRHFINSLNVIRKYIKDNFSIDSFNTYNEYYLKRKELIYDYILFLKWGEIGDYNFSKIEENNKKLSNDMETFSKVNKNNYVLLNNVFRCIDADSFSINTNGFKYTQYNVIDYNSLDSINSIWRSDDSLFHFIHIYLNEPVFVDLIEIILHDSIDYILKNITIEAFEQNDSHYEIYKNDNNKSNKLYITVRKKIISFRINIDMRNSKRDTIARIKNIKLYKETL